MKRYIFALAIVLFVDAAIAGSVTVSSSAPTVDDADIAQLTQTDSDYGSSVLWGDRPARGQTFTTDSSADQYTLSSLTLRAAGSQTANVTYHLRVGTISGASFSTVASESIATTVDVAANDYVTFTFGTPVVLSSSTLYGIDVGISGSGWASFRNTDNNSYADGSAYNSGSGGLGGSSISSLTHDRVFHLDIVITPPDVTITNNAVSGIGSTSATFNATIDIVNTNADVLVYWGRTNEVNDTNAWEYSSGVDNYSTGSSSINFATNGLLANTSYFYRFRATNDTTNVWANTSESFTTAGPPAVTNSGASGIGSGVASLNGELTDGSAATAYFYYGTTDGNSDTSVWDAVVAVGGVLEEESFAAALSNLYYGVIYNYRVFVTNDLGGVWSSVQTFQTDQPSGDAPDPVSGAYYEWDAGQDLNGDSSWPSTTANTQIWSLAGSQTPSSISDSRFNIITNAYEFPASKATATSLDSVGSNEDATFELVLDTDTDDGVIFETGGSGTGMQFDMHNGILRWTVRATSKTVVAPLTSADSNRFMHIIGTIDLSNTMKLYLDGTEVDSATGVPGDWSGGDGAGLGRISGTGASADATGGAESSDFTGKIALVRYYRNHVFSDTDVTQNFNALSIPNLSLTVSNSVSANESVSSADLGGLLDATQSVFTVVGYVSTNANVGTNAWLSDNDASVYIGDTYTNVMDYAVTVSATGLTAATDYYYTLVASNAFTNIWASSNVMFTTLGGTPPMLASTNFVDDRGGDNVTTGALVTYTVTFSQDMDAATVGTDDFGNAGDATVSIDSVTETGPNTGVFTVEVTASTTGSLQLRVNQSADLKDAAGSSLDTASAIADDTTITVETTAPTLASSDIVDNASGGPVGYGAPVVYTVTFSEAMDTNTVNSADFGNAGDAPVTVGAVSPVSGTEFTVSVTPTDTGSLQLRVNAAAELKDVAGNPLDTTSAILDDTIITVTAPTLTWDANAATAGQTDGGGTWLNANQWWNGTANQTWESEANALIGNGGNGGTLTLGAVSAVSVTFTNFSGTYTLNSGTLTNNGGVMVAANAGNITINSAIGGDGGLTMDGAGVLLLTADEANTYTGKTLVTSGVLQLGTAHTSADSIPGGIGPAVSGSNLEINGGNVRLAYYLKRTLGAGAGQLQITGGTSGFSHAQADTYGRIYINNNTSYEVVWGSAYFRPDVFVLNEDLADPTQVVNFQNKLDLNGTNRTVACNSDKVLSGYVSASNGNIPTAGGRLTGVIRNSGTAPAGLIKNGPGYLQLTAANIYDGDTTVNAGTLEIQQANPSNDASSVTIGTGATLILNYAGTDTVDKFYINGVQQMDAGTYGHTTSGADNGGQGVGALDAHFGNAAGTLTVITSRSRSTIFRFQ